ncbi:NmrA family NAD(P)-binding protein [Priestia endophytica]|uniref:NmrA family NAD(P)-binding protein n=1 Tax=Priestia endophytica TaxID=135735 RepID=UPI000DCA887A|nr:NmrA family NAD(P)-binding protein [Priestia endophytica]RAS74565.1 NmrA family protein [Priestia endophytica]
MTNKSFQEVVRSRQTNQEKVASFSADQEAPLSSQPILVTGATGKQGGATARALLTAGVPVRALVRDPGSERAKAVQALGADLVTGDLRDPASLAPALTGVRGVFSVQTPDINDLGGDSEWVQGRNLVDAARDAGVAQFVHTSVTGAGQHRDAPGWAEGRWTSMENYFGAKTAIQDRVREAGFAHWTLLKPGVFMENFVPGSFMFPRDVLATCVKPDTELALVAVDDIGVAAAAAFADPARFDRVELELASDRLTMTQIAEVLSRALGVELTAPNMTPEEAIAAGASPFAVPNDWQNEIGHPARPEFARALGIPLTSFADWARAHLTV